MALRFAIPEVKGRGAGLGNDLFPWAKAHIAAEELQLAALDPAWGLNPRRYWRYFGKSRLDWLRNRALPRLLPSFRFTEADYRATGCDDYGDAISVWAKEKGLSSHAPLVVVAEGMWGGFHGIRKARGFVLSRLYGARGAVERLYRVRRLIDSESLVVAMHIRMGDFSPATAGVDFKGRFDLSLPLDWFIGVRDCIRAALGKRVRFVVVSDGDPARQASLLGGPDTVVARSIGDNPCGDLLLLATADLLVCSVSSFSMWAAFLSQAPYIWFSGNLQEHEGYLSIWGHEPAQRAPDGATLRHIQALRTCAAGVMPRGVPVGFDGVVPDHVFRLLEEMHGMRRTASDLVQYGVVPAGRLTGAVSQEH